MKIIKISTLSVIIFSLFNCKSHDGNDNTAVEMGYFPNEINYDGECSLMSNHNRH